MWQGQWEEVGCKDKKMCRPAKKQGANDCCEVSTRVSTETMDGGLNTLRTDTPVTKPATCPK